MANKDVEGKQQTIRFHVDDIMSSHKDPKINDQFESWLQKEYGQHGKVKATRGKQHEYLGMLMDFSKKGKVRIRMEKYVKDMLETFPVKIKGIPRSRPPPWMDCLILGAEPSYQRKDKRHYIPQSQKVFF